MSEMIMTDVVTQWLIEQEWEERPEIDEENQTSSTSFGYGISEDLGVKVFFEVMERAGFFKLFMYDFDHKIPANKIPKVIEWANLVNIRVPVGHIVVMMGDARCLRFYVGMDFENATFEPAHISNMLSAAAREMARRIPQMLAICFGNLSPEDAVDYDPDENESNGEVPDAL